MKTKRVFDIFAEICKVPRPSKHEEQISQWLQSFAKEHGIECVADEAMNVIMLGGRLRKGHRYTCGPMALSALRMLHPDKAFVVPTSFVPGRGFMTNYQAMAELKQAFLSCAETTVALLDYAKVGASGLMRFGSLEDVDTVVADSDPEGLLAAEAADCDARLVIASPEA